MKMNKIKYAIISAAFVLGGMATGCDTLDIDNLNSYDESMVWDDVNLATAYVNNLYSECFGNWSAGADNNSEQVTGIPWYLGTITETGGAYKSGITRRFAILTRLSNVWKKVYWIAKRLMACWARLISCVPIHIIGWFCIMVVSLI